MNMPKKKRGPRFKPAKDGERISLGFRVTADLKRKLDAAATSSGRSQAQETELRLENSFAPNPFGSDELKNIAMMTAIAFENAARVSATAKGIAHDPKQWMADKECYLAGMRGVVVALAGAIPGLKPDEIALHAEAVFTASIPIFRTEEEMGEFFKRAQR
jgi:hypothetical protein